MVSLVVVRSAFGEFERATITINGTQREYHIYAPSNLNGNPPLVFAAHGADDDFVPYNRVRNEILAHFVDRYNCPGNSENERNYNGVSQLTKETWSPCDSGSEVSFISMAGVAHEYNPSHSRDIQQGELAWEFFKKYSLDNETVIDQAFTSNSRPPAVSARYADGAIRLEGEQTPYDVHLFDIQGKLLYSCSAGGAPSGSIAFPVRRYAGGIYMLKVSGK
ncbi:MAG: hypothetical protein JW863_16495, partial [Chitinispirillaceae bacterium]|nr:hypothetical protein [Chitinispirillaceae bacterium]